MNYLLGEIKRKENVGWVCAVALWHIPVFLFATYLMNVHFIAGNIAILVGLCQSFIVRRPVICLDC